MLLDRNAELVEAAGVLDPKILAPGLLPNPPKPPVDVEVPNPLVVEKFGVRKELFCCLLLVGVALLEEPNKLPT